MLNQQQLLRARIARMRERERDHLKSLRWHLRPNGDLIEATRQLAYLLRSRTAREEFEFDLAQMALDTTRPTSPRGGGK